MTHTAQTNKQKVSDATKQYQDAVRKASNTEAELELATEDADIERLQSQLERQDEEVAEWVEEIDYWTYKEEI